VQACLVLLAASSRALARLMPRQHSSSRVLHQMTLVQGMQPVWQSLVRS
jgi:hypothetical protein